ncbi:hypothetical protein MD484_g8136, partial [Candolleomyces efflorescens]
MPASDLLEAPQIFKVELLKLKALQEWSYCLCSNRLTGTFNLDYPERP